MPIIFFKVDQTIWLNLMGNTDLAKPKQNDKLINLTDRNKIIPQIKLGTTPIHT